MSDCSFHEKVLFAKKQIDDPECEMFDVPVDGLIEVSKATVDEGVFTEDMFSENGLDIIKFLDLIRNMEEKRKKKNQ
ncbi:hypothetical protein NOM01_04465 [Sporolactobacillus sp. STSJ-5]|uniref:hypothetical protein n=1 Tax=Sporolactobacillus sp. STSJ-5 TaxID=2965076 RepID=UPI0021061A19|nr:hypothetical protein [Sporolactobacillus sp. STSJ-5]MCQ2009247.1 hypothetical protein [Sporolactobacillus sp. STSJ-5]